jgi:DNA-binding CsgD family transcriptional regulator
MQPMGEAGVMLVGSHRPERRGRFEEAKRRVLERMLPNRRRAVQLRHPSPAETDVALAAIGGATPKTIAAGRGSSVNTVRRQIRTVFARTHSASLRDMTRLVATTMP